jgi:hypothetical protein
MKTILKYIKAHIKYGSYVIRHKWYVLQECITCNIFWRGFFHDNSKFLPDEWFPYVGSFCIDKDKYKDRFDKAWLLHQKRNPHHWQYWVLTNDEDGQYPLPMRDEYIIEMTCDWIGAGRAQGKGSPKEVIEWYVKNKDKMVLHPNTRMKVECLIGYKEIK